MARRDLARVVFALCCALMLFALCPRAEAQDAPPYLSHQGRLFDADNQPVTGVMELAFRLYDGPDADAVELWSETLSVNVANGYYTVTLGQQTALPQGLFNGEQRHLGVTVTSEGAELAPRLALNSVAYALHAAVAENAVGDITPRSITVGGQTLIDETGAWVAEPPALNTGFALSGDGSSGAPLEVDATAFAPVATSGSFGDLVDAPDTLGGLGCTGFGELPKWDGSAWTCGVDNGEVYTAGFGLALSVAGEFGVNLGEIQARVSAVCSPGEAIQVINQDGTILCATDQDTTYAAGAGLALDPGTNTFSVDSAAFQARVSSSCAAGQAIRAINADGSVVCEDDTDTDTNTTYAAGAGLTLSGTTFALNQTTVEAYARGVAFDTEAELTAALNDDYLGAGYVPSWGSLTGVPVEIADGDQNTTYTAGAGLTLAGTTFAADQATIEGWARAEAEAAQGEAFAALHYPHIDTASNAINVTAPSAGTIAYAGGDEALMMGRRVTLPSFSLPTAASRTYHLRYTLGDGWQLHDAADASYNGGVSDEADPRLDSTHDDMLVARVTTDAGNAATVTRLRNRDRMGFTWQSNVGCVNLPSTRDAWVEYIDVGAQFSQGARYDGGERHLRWNNNAYFYSRDTVRLNWGRAPVTVSYSHDSGYFGNQYGNRQFAEQINTVNRYTVVATSDWVLNNPDDCLDLTAIVSGSN